MHHFVVLCFGGVLVAFEGVLDVDVVFLVYYGLLVFMGQVWCELLYTIEIEIEFWFVFGEQIFVDPQGWIEWLFGWWVIFDVWVEVWYAVGAGW